MRLLIRLRCIERCLYEMQYHYHLQGFIYNLLKGSRYHYIHDKEGYKFFCFSNIFPIKDLEKDDLRTLIISSPVGEFIEYLYKMLSQSSQSQINIGCMKFRIDSAEKLVIKIPNNLPLTLTTGTPIIVRIPREKYGSYISGTRSKNYDYIYWRSDHPIDLFITQLENNLFKKYIEYSVLAKDSPGKNENISATLQPSPLFSFFQKFKFKKQVSTRIFMKGFNQIVIGTLWEFGFNVSVNREMLQFALDSGLGERNSLGFGFMNSYPV